MVALWKERRISARVPHRVWRRARYARRGQLRRVCEEHEGYGVSLKQKCRSSYGTVIGFSGRGEMIPNANCYCDIDPVVKDQWGIPVLRFHWAWGENESKMASGYAKDVSLYYRSRRRHSHRRYAPTSSPAEQMRPQSTQRTHIARAAILFTNWERCAWATTENLSSEPQLPGSRCQESLCGRCCALCHESG